MAKGKPEKRKFIEDVFDLDMFGRMLTLLKRDYSETKKLVEVKKAQVNEIQRAVDNLREQHRKLFELRSERITHYEKRKADNIAERDKLNEEIKNFIVQDRKGIQTSIQKCENAIELLRNKSKEATKESNASFNKVVVIQSNRVGLIKAMEAGECAECKRSVSHDDHIEIDLKLLSSKQEEAAAMEVVKRWEAEARSWDEKRVGVEEKLAAYRKQLTEAIRLTEEQKTRTKRLESIDGWIRELDQDIQSAKSSTDSFTKAIADELSRQTAENIIYDELTDKFKVLDSTKFILGDEGVKTHIIKKLIDMLNTRLTSYIRKLDGNCICTFNEYFEEEIINNKKKIRSYFNFSGAEKKAVDLACLFAFSDIKRLQGGVSYNVSIYDELFDTSLDETGVGHVINILNERVDSNNECVLIISHRKEAIKAVTGDIIYLEKRNDITKRVDYDPSLI
jgi:chromosome segregation ATPase